MSGEVAVFWFFVIASLLWAEKVGPKFASTFTHRSSHVRPPTTTVGTFLSLTTVPRADVYNTSRCPNIQAHVGVYNFTAQPQLLNRFILRITSRRLLPH